MSKSRFSTEQKVQACQEYISGEKSAKEIGGTFADQWKDIITAGHFDEHTVASPGVLQTNIGLGDCAGLIFGIYCSKYECPTAETITAKASMSFDEQIETVKK